jgi:hypothetical protein
MQGVLTGPDGGYNITYARFSDPTVLINGQTPQWYVTRMVDRIGGGLDPGILSSIDTVLAAAATQCTSNGLPAPPPATAGDVIRGSVAIADYVIPKVINDLTYAPNAAEYGPWRSELGRDFWLLARNYGLKKHPERDTFLLMTSDHSTGRLLPDALRLSHKFVGDSRVSCLSS